MDLSKLSAQVKGFQRRTTQKVLQQMGIAEKTEDEGQAYQNFLALGSFASQLKTTIQAADACFEKTCTAQTHLAGQIQSYLASELSGDAELPPGELHDYFNASDATRAHADTLQEVSGKFYAACSELGGNALQAILNQLEDLVLRPIINDEEFANMTKDILEDKKKATLDFDSYRRMAANNSSPGEQEKARERLRAAQDRFESTSKRLAEHIEARNQIRCKLLVHGILTAMQQFCNYYFHAYNIFRDTALSLQPLVAAYQLNESQLQSAFNLHEQPSLNVKSSNNARGAASSVFDDYEKQNNNHTKADPRLKPTAKTSAAASQGLGTSPKLDELMRDNTLNLAAKPAATPLKNTPMNQYGATSKVSPQPTRHPSPHVPHPAQQAQQSQPPRNQSPPITTQQKMPQAAHQHIDLFENAPPPQRVQSPVPPAEILVDLNTSGNLLFDGPLGGAPPMQPANADLLGAFAAPTVKPTSPTPISSVDPFGSFGTGPTPTTKPTSPTPSSNGNNPNLFFNPDPIQPTKQANDPLQPSKSNDPFSFSTNNTGNNSNNPYGWMDEIGGQPTKGTGSSGGGQQVKNSAGPTPKPATVGVAAAQANQGVRGELNPAVTARIDNWASRGGRQNNLRALLSTLHEVIWVDSGWDALSLSDLITPAQVKKAYHSANKIVHPDKVQSGTIEQQLMAQRIFEALRVSYTTFSNEPK